MKVTFLGTGTSTGVPELLCNCEVCRSRDPRDRRSRCSVWIEVGEKHLLIDCGPDFYYQALAHIHTLMDAVLITHEHYDHVGGLDDLRPFCFRKDLPIYAEANVCEAIRTRLPYVFREENRYPGVPNFYLVAIGEEPFRAAEIPVQPIRVMHGRLPILGYRIGDFAYITDMKSLPEPEYEKLQGLDVLVVNALRRDSRHPSHQGLDMALEEIERLRPRRAYLTHLSHRMGLHAEVEKLLPPHVHLAYDGLEITTDYKR